MLRWQRGIANAGITGERHLGKGEGPSAPGARGREQEGPRLLRGHHWGFSLLKKLQVSRRAVGHNKAGDSETGFFSSINKPVKENMQTDFPLAFSLRGQVGAGPAHTPPRLLPLTAAGPEGAHGSSGPDLGSFSPPDLSLKQIHQGALSRAPDVDGPLTSGT